MYIVVGLNTQYRLYRIGEYPDGSCGVGWFGIGLYIAVKAGNSAECPVMVVVGLTVVEGLIVAPAPQPHSVGIDIIDYCRVVIFCSDGVAEKRACAPKSI